MKCLQNCDLKSLPSAIERDPFINGNLISDFSLKTPNYYILSNDKVLVKKSPAAVDDSVFIGIAAPHVLHVVYEIYKDLSPSRLIFIDSNINQLAHLSRLIQWLIESSCRYEFISKVFCGTISQDGIFLLDNLVVEKKGFIRGAENINDIALLSYEKKFWSEFELDEELFFNTYGRSVKKIEGGLLTELTSIGEINSSILTLLCGAKKHYPTWPFTLGFGSGYLRNEESFNKLKSILISSPSTLVFGDITSYGKTLIYYFKYFPLVIWTSNIFCDWFSNRYPTIKSFFSLLNTIGKQVEPDLPEFDIYLYQDARDTWHIPQYIRPDWSRKRPRVSSHTKAFREVSKRLDGINNLEIINEPRWIKEDNGESKLICTEYLLFSATVQNINQFYDCIFLHILIGHNVKISDFNTFLIKAKKYCNKLIILEHYRYSPDFFHKKNLIAPGHIRRILGQEKEVLLIHGKFPWVRNFLMVY